MAAWLIFFTVIVSLIIFDLGIIHKNQQKLTFSQSIYLSAFYFTIACLFSLYIFYAMGAESAKEYFTGFIIEKALSLDNIFVIAIIFRFFAIPPVYQHKVLVFGILGVLIFRAILIGLGISLITKFAWIMYIFALILFFTGVKILYLSNKQLNISELYIYKFLQKYLPLTTKITDGSFVTKINGKFYITPLFMALIIIETMDIVFAVDSIPAIFAVTTDPYIVYTSNIFAILGLRALFFCLNGIIERFRYVKYSLGLILIFISIKIFAKPVIEIPVYVTLLTTMCLLVGGVVFSVWRRVKSF